MKKNILFLFLIATRLFCTQDLDGFVQWVTFQLRGFLSLYPKKLKINLIKLNTTHVVAA